MMSKWIHMMRATSTGGAVEKEGVLPALLDIVVF